MGEQALFLGRGRGTRAQGWVARGLGRRRVWWWWRWLRVWCSLCGLSVGPSSDNGQADGGTERSEAENRGLEDGG